MAIIFHNHVGITVIQLRYMAELLGVDITIGGPRHAGSYDPKIF